MNDVPPCAGMADLFENVARHADAKAICDTCPLIEPCAQLRDLNQAQARPGCGYVGTWAGELLLVYNGEARAKRNAAKKAKKVDRRCLHCPTRIQPPAKLCDPCRARSVEQQRENARERRNRRRINQQATEARARWDEHKETARAS